MKTVAIYGISPEIRLHLKLVSAIRRKSMAQMVSQLIETAYNEDKISIGRKEKSKLRRIIKRWA